MSLSVDLITSIDDLSSSDMERWNDLAATPFLRWEWLGSWWKAYGQKQILHVMAVRRDGLLIGIAPWFMENRVTTGRTIQFLASGEACTDHLSLLVQPDDRRDVCDAIAQWLMDAGSNDTIPKRCVWDAIELIGVDASDETMNCLCDLMQQRGLTVDRSEGMGCYVIDLPSEWDKYVQMRSKSGRREIRQSLKNIDEGAIRVRHVRNQRELNEAWGPFVDLHQRRRRDAGTTGCFDDPQFESFLRDAADQLLQAGLLELVIASIDESPVAAQFAVVADDCWYFYQSGMDPNAAQLRPGLSLFCHSIRHSIQSGRKRFDMMRGDEPYKLRWRAELQPAEEIRVCSPRAAAQLRSQVYNTGLAFKNLLKSGVGLAVRH